MSVLEVLVYAHTTMLTGAVILYNHCFLITLLTRMKECITYPVYSVVDCANFCNSLSLHLLLFL